MTTGLFVHRAQNGKHGARRGNAGPPVSLWTRDRANQYDDLLADDVPFHEIARRMGLTTTQVYARFEQIKRSFPDRAQLK